MLFLLPWPGCRHKDSELTYKFVEVTGKKLEIFCGAVRVGQTGERILVEKFGAGVEGLAKQDNQDGTTEYVALTDKAEDTRLIFKLDGKEVKVAEEDWLARPQPASSTGGGRVTIKIRVVGD